jgi:hypothetical protein
MNPGKKGNKSPKTSKKSGADIKTEKMDIYV